MLRNYFIQRVSLSRLLRKNKTLFSGTERCFLRVMENTHLCKDLRDVQRNLTNFHRRLDQTMLLSLDSEYFAKPTNELLIKAGISRAFISTWDSYSDNPLYPIPSAKPFDGLTPYEAFAKAESENKHWRSEYGTLQYELGLHIVKEISNLISKIEEKAKWL